MDLYSVDPVNPVKKARFWWSILRRARRSAKKERVGDGRDASVLSYPGSRSDSLAFCMTFVLVAGKGNRSCTLMNANKEGTSIMNNQR